MLKKLTVSLISLSLSSVFFVNQHPVLACSLQQYQTKIVANNNYGIYQSLTRKGPVRQMGVTGTFKYSHFQASSVKKIKHNTYWYVLINGHKAGWVNQSAFARNKISVAKRVSLVKNPYYDFNVKDAINYITDSSGSVVDLDKVHVSQNTVSSAKAGIHNITYTYGKGKAHSLIRVRNDQYEGIVNANKKPQMGKSGVTWFKHFKTSGNWGKGSSYAPETKPHVLKNGNFKLKTVFYQPATLSQGDSKLGVVGPLPEGLAVSDGRMYATMYDRPTRTHAHIVSYQLNQIPNRYVMQKLPWLPWPEFARLSATIKVSPLIKLGHGQAISTSKKYIYVIANNHLLRNNPESEEIMQISKNDLQIKKIWTFKIWDQKSEYGRYVHNAVFLNDHKFIAVYHSSTMNRFEYWEVTRHGNSWYPKEIGATKGEFMRNNSPVQGIAYDKHKKQIYLAFNDYLFKLNRKGRVIENGHFNTGREFEGICVDNKTFYAELAQRPELLKQKLK
ncbi:SH3-like domain-containing protein [Lactobacillus acidophilus]|uniref:SH3-like domain-containing protein n=1 Tax=Lactobacillus acidophilus TaxID=1579 RepID=UPI0036F343BA